MAEPIRIAAAAETISADELAFHRRVTSGLRTAQGVAQVWTDHLAEKYHLSTGDQILDDGTIGRQAPEG